MRPAALFERGRFFPEKIAENPGDFQEHLRLAFKIRLTGYSYITDKKRYT
jgi:hypothetical protein